MANSIIRNCEITRSDCLEGEMESDCLNDKSIDKDPCKKRIDAAFNLSWTVLPVSVVIVLIFITLLALIRSPFIIKSTVALEIDGNEYGGNMRKCSVQLVESIPIGLNYTEEYPVYLSTYNAWKLLLENAKYSVDIASMYWTLRGSDVLNHSTAQQGEDIFNNILTLGKTDRVKIRIAQNKPSEPNLDTDLLQKEHAAEVRSVDFPKYFGGGVLHTKLWIVDDRHVYLGSANMDWRSLTQVKELGVLAHDCPALAKDVQKIFNIYWYMGINTSTIPPKWPKDYSTQYNINTPMQLKFNNISMSAFFSSSPPPFSADGRTGDLEAILSVISSATKFVQIAVMDYFPLKIYVKPWRYWPYIDDALRKAAVENQIHVQMLISWWPHSRAAEDYFLRSLVSLSNAVEGTVIEIKRFVVPSNEDEAKIPYSRVNHNKYMVTDNTAYIGTSNWSGDYFTDTAGIGFILKDDDGAGNKTNLRTELLGIFQRDWQSPYAVILK